MLKIKNKLHKPPVKIVMIISLAIVITLFIVNLLPNKKYSPSCAKDLMKDVDAVEVETKPISDNFVKSLEDFSVELLKSSMNKDGSKVISPMSVYIALSMTANGAEGETLKEFEKVLGKYDLTMEDINQYCYSLNESISEKGKVNIANSIWYRDNPSLKIGKDFLQTNGNYYKGDAYKSDFNSSKTIKDINGWIKNKTNGLVEEVIKEIPKDTIMYLINTIYFHCQWQQVYKKDQVRKGTFILKDGEKDNVDFMHSTERYYLEDSMAKGFIKPYQDDKYSFMALLPNEGVALENYINTLNGEKFLNIIGNKQQASVITAMPKFKVETSLELKEQLKNMGLKKAFDEDNRDFSKMVLDTQDPVYINKVLHKTYIEVGEKGTKAGAATAVEMNKESAMSSEKSVILNRPFLYAIIDNGTGIPLFLGTMENPK